MPIFKKILQYEGENKNNIANQKLLVDYYTSIFLTKNPSWGIENFFSYPIIPPSLVNLSKEYILQLKKVENNIEKNDDNIKGIFYQKLIPLDVSTDNLLFLKFMKFHVNFLKFSSLFEENKFERFALEESKIKDYISSSFFQCLENSKKKNQNELHKMTETQLISNLCVKERLTFFNYLTKNRVKVNEAKNYINSQYMKYFRGKSYIPEINNKELQFQDFLEIYEIK
jgi:hypothetical protein